MGEERKVKGAWLKVFCPEARCLRDEEVMDLPRETREHPDVQGKQGIWMEVFCPDASCLREEEKVDIPVTREKPEEKGRWLRLFCPDEQCVVEEETDLP